MDKVSDETRNENISDRENVNRTNFQFIFSSRLFTTIYKLYFHPPFHPHLSQLTNVIYPGLVI